VFDIAMGVTGAKKFHFHAPETPAAEKLMKPKGMSRHESLH